MKKLLPIAVVFFLTPSLSFAAVCSKSSEIKALFASSGDAGITFSTPISGCICEGNYAWIDSASAGGKQMYALAMSAKMTGKTVNIMVQDGLGQGAPGNDSITYRVWPTCELKAIDIN